MPVIKPKYIISVMVILLLSCDGQRLNFDGGIIPPLPVNFSSVNSSYDDFNSDLDITWSGKYFSLIFSSNRNSGGQDFDLIGYEGKIISDLVSGNFRMEADTKEYSILEAINSRYDELGPFFTSDLKYRPVWKSGTGEKRFFYSSDVNGHYDIYYCYYSTGELDFVAEGEPLMLNNLNTAYNEGYLTILESNAANRETACFSSDRGGNYDIWQAVSNEGTTIETSPALTVAKIDEVSSSADDKCPYICGNLLVFTSDRAGGFGGFDLWYSLWNGQKWSTPVNFGEDINTQYDEYRPVVVSTEADGFLNDLMIFSSNRPGGKGLYDLYYVGILRHE